MYSVSYDKDNNETISMRNINNIIIRLKNIQFKLTIWLRRIVGVVRKKKRKYLKVKCQLYVSKYLAKGHISPYICVNMFFKYFKTTAIKL